MSALFSFINHCDPATVAAYTDGGDRVSAIAHADLPLANVLNSDATLPTEVGNVTSPQFATLRIDFGATVAVDVVALLGARHSVATWSSGITSPFVLVLLELYNASMVLQWSSSTQIPTIAGLPSTLANLFVPLTSTVNARYLVVGVRGAGSPAPSTSWIGRVWAGSALRYADEFAPGWRLAPIDLGKVSESRRGVGYPSPRSAQVELGGRVECLTDAQVYGANTFAGGVTLGWEDMVAQASTGKHVVIVPRRVESAIYGMFSELPVPKRSIADGTWNVEFRAREAA